MEDYKKKKKTTIRFRVCAFPFLKSRSRERNRVTRSTPTYFRQTCGLLSNRDVRTVCSCQPSDFSTKSRHRQRGRARRSERTTTALRRGALDFTFITRPAKRFAHSLSSVRTYVRTRVYAYQYMQPSTRVLNASRVLFLLSRSLVIVSKNRYAPSPRRKSALGGELNLFFAETSLNFDISESECERQTLS